MTSLQIEVEEFCKAHKLECPIEFRLLDLLSELGEVAKEILKASQYGKTTATFSSSLGEEMGDLQFSLFALANRAGVDLELVTRDALNKYKDRIELKGHAGSN